MVTHIYVESDSKALQERERQLIFVVEYYEDGEQVKDGNGEPVVLKGRGKSKVTYADGILFALYSALKAAGYREKMHIHTTNTYVANMIGNQLDQWRERDYCKTDGTPIKSQMIWRRIGKLLEGSDVVVSSDRHAYYNWMIDQMNAWKEPPKNEKPA